MEDDWDRCIIDNTLVLFQTVSVLSHKFSPIYSHRQWATQQGLHLGQHRLELRELRDLRVWQLAASLRVDAWCWKTRWDETATTMIWWGFVRAIAELVMDRV